MKVRALTVGLCGSGNWEVFHGRIRDAAQVARRLERAISDGNIEVQTVRLATDPFGGWISGLDLSSIESALEEEGIDFMAFGKALTEDDLSTAAVILAKSPRFSLSAVLGSVNGLPDESKARRIAELLGKVEYPQGFNFCVSVNVPDGVPFFPAASRTAPSDDDEATSFTVSIGLENSDLLVKLSQASSCTADFSRRLTDALQSQLEDLERIVKDELSRNYGHAVRYLGVDPSWNPSVREEESIIRAFETLLGAPFGSAGTLAVAAATTAALRALRVQTIGYVGLMLPVMEDFVLAQRVREERVGINMLLSLSSVCGVGLDTIPVSTDVGIDRLYFLLLDVASLSCRWGKPLTLRLIRMNGAEGEVPTVDHPRLLPAPLMSVDC